MPLSPIPLDPRPTRGEFAAEIQRQRGRIANELLTNWARLNWECERKRKSPDDFVWPFSSWLLAYDPGFKYHEYLKSDLWYQIRDRVLVAARYQCAGCFNTAGHVHHRDYRPRVLRGGDDSPLVALCKRCHDRVHANAPSWQEIERRLAEIVHFKDSKVAERAELRRARVAGKHAGKRDDNAFPGLNGRNRERQREYRRLKNLGGGDITKGRAIEAEERRSKMSPYDLGVEDAYSRLAALRKYNVRSPDRCPFIKGSPEEAEYDRGLQDTMQKQHG